MSVTELSVVNQNTSVMDSYTREQINLIKSTVARDATDGELKLFLYTAQRTGLDPLTKQIHFVKRAGQMTIQTGIDGYRAIAERSGTLAGIDDPVYDSEDEPHPNKATVKVRRLLNGVMCEYSASARWSEYFPGEKQGFMWKKMPYLMLGKCAEALALRKAFPNDLSGVYTHEEMQQADREPINVTPEEPKQKKLPQVKVKALEALRERAKQNETEFLTNLGVMCKMEVHSYDDLLSVKNLDEVINAIDKALSQKEFKEGAK